MNHRLFFVILVYESSMTISQYLTAHNNLFDSSDSVRAVVVSLPPVISHVAETIIAFRLIISGMTSSSCLPLNIYRLLISCQVLELLIFYFFIMTTFFLIAYMTRINTLSCVSRTRHVKCVSMRSLDKTSAGGNV